MIRTALVLTTAFTISAFSQTPSATSDGFALPQPNRTFVFPRDHGSHPEFRTEWWYVTGHLNEANGSRFGFQATFFRQSSPGHQQLFVAHCALLDAATGRFISEERLNREGWDAGSSSTELNVHNGNWSLAMDASLQLKATVRAEAMLSLSLTPSKPLVIFGLNGVSKKGASPEAASHYLTFPRLKCEGTIRLGRNDIPVTGTAWMDHEFSSSQLDKGQVGWDWASLQLNDGRDMMVYRMRHADGTSDPAGTTLSWVSKEGNVEQVPASGFHWDAKRRWTSPKTGAVYPVECEISSQGESFHLKPLNDAQELDGTVSGLPYWEGACDVVDINGKLIGRAFLELAGYAGDLVRHLGGQPSK